MKEINVKALALAFGIAWGTMVLLTGWAAAFLNWGVGLVNLASLIYIGFKPTFLGGIIGGLWGLLDGLIYGAIIGFVYNKAAKYF